MIYTAGLEGIVQSWDTERDAEPFYEFYNTRNYRLVCECEELIIIVVKWLTNATVIIATGSHQWTFHNPQEPYWPDVPKETSTLVL